MAIPTAKRRADSSLEERILERGDSFELYQLIRLVLRLRRDRIPIGYGGPPEREALRLYGVHELASPVGSVTSVALQPPYKRDHESLIPIHVRTPSALTDPYNPCSLPTVYTEQIRKALDIDRNQAPAEFIDLFNHRLLSLEYRAWEKSRPYIRYEREAEAGLNRQTLSLWVQSLMGCGTRALADRLQVSDHLMFRYSAFFMSVARPAANLGTMLQDFFGVQAEIHEFRGKWCPVSPRDRASLEPRGARLGEGCMLGSRTWYQQATIKVRLGELTLNRFLDFLPGTRGFGEVVEFVHHFTRRQFEDIEIELAVKLSSEDLLQLKLATGKIPLRLGWLTWLRAQAGTSGVEVRAVLFRSTESLAMTRYWVQEGLIKIRRRWQNRRFSVSWTEEVVQTLMACCGRARATRLRIASLLEELVEKRLTMVFENGGEEAGDVAIESSGRVLSFHRR